jgi:hypothetical protein
MIRFYLLHPNFNYRFFTTFILCIKDILKSYTKTKIIEYIVETVVGTKVDREAIGDIDIK